MLKVFLYHSPQPRTVLEEELRLPQGSSVLDALTSLKTLDSNLFLEPKNGELNQFSLKAGYQISVWSRPAVFDKFLRDLDRIEISRPIKVDPKVARRERFKKQGSKGAGLFAKKRPGAKAGY